MYKVVPSLVYPAAMAFLGKPSLFRIQLVDPGGTESTYKIQLLCLETQISFNIVVICS